MTRLSAPPPGCIEMLPACFACIRASGLGVVYCLASAPICCPYSWYSSVFFSMACSFTRPSRQRAYLLPVLLVFLGLLLDGVFLHAAFTSAAGPRFLVVE